MKSIGRGISADAEVHKEGNSCHAGDTGNLTPVLCNCSHGKG